MELQSATFLHDEAMLLHFFFYLNLKKTKTKQKINLSKFSSLKFPNFRSNKMESVWYGVAKVSKSPLHAGGCTALTKKKNTTKTFYFLLQRNVTSKTNALLHQPGAFLSGSFLFFFRHIGPDTCLEFHILQTSVNIRPVSEVTPQNSGKEKKQNILLLKR